VTNPGSRKTFYSPVRILHTL